MSKKEWDSLDEDMKEAIIKIAKAKNCSLDEAYNQGMLIGGAFLMLGLALSM